MSSEFDDDFEVEGVSGLDRVLFCFAVEQEAKFFYQPGMDKLITGIGRENAERSLHQRLKEEPYQLVLSCGFAGGLNPYLSTGTVVFAADEDAGLTPLLLSAGACLAISVLPSFNEAISHRHHRNRPDRSQREFAD